MKTVTINAMLGVLILVGLCSFGMLVPMLGLILFWVLGIMCIMEISR